jgi:magnesium chelatase subunit D
VCAAFDVDGLRADIVTACTAVAHAAWQGRTSVTRADIRRAATLALPHRRRRNPFDAPGLDEQLLDRILGDEEPPPDPPEPSAPGGSDDPLDADDFSDGDDLPGADDPSHADGPAEAPSGEGAGQEQSPVPARHEPGDASGDAPIPPRGGDTPAPATAAAPYRPRLFTVRGTGEGADGRRSRAVGERGHRIGAAAPGRGARDSIHLVETVRAAAARRQGRAPGGGRLRLHPDDLRVAVREGRETNLVLFCVDASGSMAARKRMTQVKTAILSLLLDAYRRRDKVGLVTFRGRRAELTLPPTRSVDIAATRLDDLPAGGRTPLAEGLWEAARVLRRERLRDPRLRPLLVVVTDGRATSGPGAVGRALRAAEHVAGLGVTTVVVDGESGPLRLGLAATLAARLGAEHLPVSEVSADALSGAVRERAA